MIDSALEDAEAAQSLHQIAVWNLNLIGSFSTLICCTAADVNFIYITLSQSVNLSNLWQIMWRIQCNDPVIQSCWDERIQACILFIVPQLKFLFELWDVFIIREPAVTVQRCTDNWVCYLKRIKLCLTAKCPLFYEWSKDDSFRAIADVNWQANIFIESGKHSGSSESAASLEMYHNSSKSVGNTVVESSWFRFGND